MFIRKKAVFSNDGELFAFANEQGSLKIWETYSNTLKQEYVLNSHANLTCSSLIWGPSKNGINALDKSSSVESDILDPKNQYLVIGTEEGNVILYNYDEGKLNFNFATSHTDSVNDLIWHADSNRVFSCSNDKSIIIWDLASGKLISKWEADDKPLYSLCVIDSDNLLSASTSVFWWNINEQTIIKKFDGHDSAIFSLLLLSSTDSSLNSYFLSTAYGESKISAWHLKKGNSKALVASFDVSDELQSMDVTKNFSKDKPMFLSTVTKGGSLLLFKHVLNGETKKNLTPQMTLHVVSKPTSEFSEPSSILVIASKFSKCSESSIIAYGSFENPTFEKVKIIDCPKTLTLARDKTLQVHSSDGVIPNVKLFNKFGEFISANGDLSDPNSSNSPSKRRKQKDPGIDLIDAEEMIDIRTVSPDYRTATKSPTKNRQQRKRDKELSASLHSHTEDKDLALTDPNSICNSLLQCLEKEDKNLLNEVLHQVRDDHLVRNSVEKLPHRSLPLFLSELHKILINPEQRYTSSSRKWLKEILNVHLSYLRTCQDTVGILNMFKEYLDSKRVGETLVKLTTLRGLLNIHRIQHASQLFSDSNTEEQMES